MLCHLKRSQFHLFASVKALQGLNYIQIHLNYIIEVIAGGKEHYKEHGAGFFQLIIVREVASKLIIWGWDWNPFSTAPPFLPKLICIANQL